MQIDRVGTFRGGVLEHAVSVTSGGFPQLVAKLHGVEYFDEESGEWVDWSEVAENELTAYLVLFDGSNNRTLNCQQVEKVFAWDGTSFEVLDAVDPSTIKIQFRVESHTYQEKTSLQVKWIDEYDATPGTSVRKLDASELKQLQAKYASILKKGSTTAPAKAPTAKPKAPAAAKPKVPAAAKSAPPARTAALTPAADLALPVGKCTKQEAWDIVVDLKDKKVTDKKLSQSWRNAVDKIAGKVPDDNVTEEQWFQIRETVLQETAVF